MARYYYDTLTAVDYAMLVHETTTTHMHVTGLATFSPGPLATKDGGIDFAKLKKAVADSLHKVPRYRQKLMWVEEEKKSLLGHMVSWVQPDTGYPPVWVDDPDFDLDYHVRHTSLPRPGTNEQLKTLVGQIMSQQLDRSRPLWEVHIIEGLEGGDFACVSKMHHCMVDGESGIDLTAVLMHVDPNHVPEDGPRYRPRKAPTQAELRQEMRRATRQKPWKVLRNLQDFSRESEDLGHEIVERTRAVGELLTGTMGMKRVESPVNGQSSAQRLYDWLDLPFADVRKVSRATDTTINDVVLAMVTGAVRDYCGARGFDVKRESFRVTAPVAMRKRLGSKGEGSDIGNEISNWTVPLPIDERSAMQQLDIIHEQTLTLKDSRVVIGSQVITSITSLHPPLMCLMMEHAFDAVNMVVTNMPGPQFALYQCGAEMKAVRPCVPLNDKIGLVVGILSYNGQISFGLSADPAIMDDLGEFRDDLEKAFRRLQKAAANTGAPKQKPAAKRKPAEEKEAVASKTSATAKKSATKKKAAGKTAPGSGAAGGKRAASSD